MEEMEHVEDRHYIKFIRSLFNIELSNTSIVIIFY